MHTAPNLVVLLAILSISAPAVSQKCSVGSFRSGVKCKLCPPGSYQDRKNATSCNKCPAGTYAEFSGAQGLDLCLPCPPGTLSKTIGASSASVCAPCPAGQSSPAGSAVCISCQAGTFISQRQESFACEKCERRTFTPRSNMLHCLDCPEGTVPNKKRTSCSKCRKGTEPDSSKPTKCSRCEGTSFNDGSSVRCKSCPSFLVSNPKGTGCIPCPLGSARSFLTQSCTPCRDGQNTRSKRPRCVPDGTPCPANHFEDEDGACRTCTTREKFDATRRRCVPCKANEISEGGLAETCSTTCGPNQIVLPRRSICACADGFAGMPPGDCTICPPGTSYGRSFTDRSHCDACNPGSFSDKPGMTQCTPCPQGQVQPKTGQTSCDSCPKGLIPSNEFLGSRRRPFFANPARRLSGFRFSWNVRSDCVSPQTNCRPGEERVVDRPNKRFSCQPRSCPPDTLEVFKRPRGGEFRVKLRSCISCAQGRFLKPEDGKCEPCKFRQTGVGGLSTTCTDCPNQSFGELSPFLIDKCECYSHGFGLFRPGLAIRNGRCLRCPPGTSGIDGGSVCRRCKAGTSAYASGQLDCFMCRSGFYSPDEGAMECIPCPEGTTSYGLGESRCVPIGGE